MKLTDKISWLMGCVQRSLFPHLNQCLKTPLTEQEERLVSMLEILQIDETVAHKQAERLRKLRAERSGTGNGRIYTITYMVTDACGNSTTMQVTVSVPHNQ